MFGKNKNYLRIITATLLSVLLASCIRVGPGFHSPCAPTCGYAECPLPAKTAATPGACEAGKSQQYICAQDIPAGWWYLFHSPEINQLVAIGLANSPNLFAAEAALRQAQENVNVQIGNSLLPAINGVGSITRENANAAGFGSSTSNTTNTATGTTSTTSTGGTTGVLPVPSVFNLYNVAFNISYNPDVFGGSQRQIEALIAQADFQQFQLMAAYLTLTSNIVTTAITVASLEEQIRATNMLIKIQQDQLSILQKQLQLGGIGAPNVLTQLTLVEQTRATLPPLQKSLSQALHSLTTLMGVCPDQPIPGIDLDKLVLPDQIPVSLPACLVRQRPDVRASEAKLHAANALIGVATAQLLPQFNITGNYGWSALTPPELFTPETLFWTITSQALQPIFHGGALHAQRRSAIAGYQQAVAQYRQTVLQGLQNMADSLRAIETDARTFQAATLAEKAALANLKINQTQLKDGGVSYLNVLTAQQQYQETVLVRIQSQAARYTDTAALFQAAGGGWWNRNICHDPINPTNTSLAPTCTR